MPETVSVYFDGFSFTKYKWQILNYWHKRPSYLINIRKIGGLVMSEDRVNFKNQNIVIEDRNRINISGVDQVDSFNETTIVLSTVKGGLSIKGEELNISKLNLDEGSVKISGMINSLTYISKEGTPKNFMGKIFK